MRAEEPRNRPDAARYPRPSDVPDLEVFKPPPVPVSVVLALAILGPALYGLWLLVQVLGDLLRQSLGV